MMQLGHQGNGNGAMVSFVVAQRDRSHSIFQNESVATILFVRTFVKWLQFVGLDKLHSRVLRGLIFLY